MGFGIGSFLEACADKLGAPEWVGDAVGVVADGALICGAVAIGQPQLVGVIAPDLIDGLKDLAEGAEDHGSGAGSTGGAPASKPGSDFVAWKPGQSGLPGPDDVAGWIAFLKTHDYKDFQRAVKDHKIGKTVFADPEFAELHQTKSQEDQAYWSTLSMMNQNNSASIHAILRG